MRWTTKTALVAACSLGAVSGARAQDATDGPRGSVVFAAGDKVHGHVRGGETHVLQVHLAKGDVFSFSVAVAKTDVQLLLHLTFRDPNGREANAAAHVVHAANGKRVKLGRYRAPKSGTYAVELSGDGPFEGRYAGASKVKSARSKYALPADGASVAVDVAAGATIRLRAANGLNKLVMALPGKSPSEMPTSDALVVALRARGLASSQTGTYWFAAPGARGASIEIRRPHWKAADVAFPTISGDDALAAYAARLAAFQSAATASQSSGVEAVGGSGGNSTLFLGAGSSSSADFADHLHGMLAPTPGGDNPVTGGDVSSDGLSYYNVPSIGPVGETTPAGTPMKGAGGPTVPRVYCAQTVGYSVFQYAAVATGWRYAPWTSATNYPQSVRSRLLLSGAPAGSVSSTMRYFVDGHEVPALLASGGEAVIEWTVRGAGLIDGAEWTIDGSWTMTMHDLSVVPGRSMQSLPGTCTLSGSESFKTGGLTETVSTSGLTSTMDVWFFDPVGVIRNTLTAPELGITQTVVRDMRQSKYAASDPNHEDDPTKVIRVTTTTTDPSTGGEVGDDEIFVAIIC